MDASIVVEQPKMDTPDSRGPLAENAGAKNALPLPEALQTEDSLLKAQTYVHFQAANGLFLDINSNGWAVWSPDSHAVFSTYEYKGGLYLVYEYGNSYTGQYLSYSSSGYLGIYPWSDSVAWNSNPLSVSGKTWKTYEWTAQKRWIVIGDYDNNKSYVLRDLSKKTGF